MKFASKKEFKKDGDLDTYDLLQTFFRSMDYMN